MRGFAVLAVALASTAPVGAAAEKLHFKDRVERIAEMSTSVKSCERFGYKADVYGIKIEAVHATDDAYLDGFSDDQATDLINATFAAEKKKLEDYNASLLDITPPEGAMARLFEFWRERCERIATDPFSARFFKRE